LFLLRYLL